MFSKQFKIGYLSALIDGEGGVYVYLRKNRKGVKTWHSYRITLCNTDAGIINRAVTFFRDLGFSPHILKKTPRNPYHKTYYEVDLRNNDFPLAKKLLNFASTGKTEKLEIATNRLLQRPRNRIPNISILQDDYNILNLSFAGIAKKYKVSRESIRRRLREHVTIKSFTEQAKYLKRSSGGHFILTS